MQGLNNSSAKGYLNFTEGSGQMVGSSQYPGHSMLAHSNSVRMPQQQPLHWQNVNGSVCLQSPEASQYLNTSTNASFHEVTPANTPEIIEISSGEEDWVLPGDSHGKLAKRIVSQATRQKRKGKRITNKPYNCLLIRIRSC